MVNTVTSASRAQEEERETIHQKSFEFDLVVVFHFFIQEEATTKRGSQAKRPTEEVQSKKRKLKSFEG